MFCYTPSKLTLRVVDVMSQCTVVLLTLALCS